nr:rna polymerase ii transcription factor b subunit 5 [Quercus suber]POF01104.1 rna polymerase ii transcription factor b subunit 5 [Quercus suber]
MPTYMLGTLVECDASIAAILTKINETHGHKYIAQHIDDEHLLVKTVLLDELKARLTEELERNNKLEANPKDSDSE